LGTRGAGNGFGRSGVFPLFSRSWREIAGDKRGFISGYSRGRTCMQPTTAKEAHGRREDRSTRTCRGGSHATRRPETNARLGNRLQKGDDFCCRRKWGRVLRRLNRREGNPFAQ